MSALERAVPAELPTKQAEEAGVGAPVNTDSADSVVLGGVHQGSDVDPVERLFSRLGIEPVTGASCFAFIELQRTSLLADVSERLLHQGPVSAPKASQHVPIRKGVGANVADGLVMARRPFDVARPIDSCRVTIREQREQHLRAVKGAPAIRRVKSGWANRLDRIQHERQQCSWAEPPAQISGRALDASLGSGLICRRHLFSVLFARPLWSRDFVLRSQVIIR